MSQERKAIQENVQSNSPAICVTKFCGPNAQSKLQLTQGVGAALKGEAGFIQVNKSQAMELIASLAQFVGEFELGCSEEQFLESLHEEA